MMTISLSDAGKRFNRDWIFRHINYTFNAGQSYAITGANGSGKSTLLQVLSGGMLHSEGTVEYMLNSAMYTTEKIFNEVSICAPYLELIEEMTLYEFLAFHQRFKSFLPEISIDTIIETISLEKARNKQIRFYSSGMKQRVKLAQCIFSQTAIVLLDEPCTNLDTAGVELYHQLIQQYCSNRLVIVSSNDAIEYRFCKEKISMEDFK